MRGQRQDTVLMTRLWTRVNISRYQILSERHEYLMILSEQRLLETYPKE